MNNGGGRAAEDRNDIQRELLSGELYQEVVKTAEKLRHRSEYDVSSVEDRRFAALCFALQHSAHPTIGSSINLAGVYRVLAELQGRAR